MRRTYVLLCFCFIAMPTEALPQKIAPDLPALVSYDVPEYPSLVRQARIQGDVRIDVITNGTGVASAVALEGHKLLLESSVQNVKTWRFAPHEPQKFVLSYHFQIADKARVELRPPADVIVAGKQPEVMADCFPPSIGNWRLTVAAPMQTAEAELTLKAGCDDWLGGEGTTADGAELDLSAGLLNVEHVEFCIKGAMLGAAETLVLFKGRMQGNEMIGTFSDAAGTQGTWTARRQ
jgi:hypothetical protein